MTEVERWDRIWSGLVAAVGVGVAAFAAVDLDRERADIAAGRTHMTGTTFSSFNRRKVAQLGSVGPTLFRVGMVSGGSGFLAWYIPHIANRIDNRKADW